MGDEVLPQAAAILRPLQRLAARLEDAVPQVLQECWPGSRADLVHRTNKPGHQPFRRSTVSQQKVLLLAGVDSEQREQGNVGHEGWWRWLQQVPPDEMRSGRQWQLGPLADVAQQGADAVHFEHKNV